MAMDRLAVHTTVSHIPRNGEELRVVRVARPPKRMALQTFHHNHGFDLHTDRRGAACLATVWALAQRSPRSLIHLPIRSNRPPSDVAPDSPPLDLVLVHASAQFRTSEWKTVRARTGSGLAHKIDLGTIRQELRSLDETDFSSANHQGYPHHLRYATAAETLFVIGSTPAFTREGALLRAFVEEFDDAHAGQHHCVELRPRGWKPQKRRIGPAGLHIVRETERWPAADSHGQRLSRRI